MSLYHSLHNLSTADFYAQGTSRKRKISTATRELFEIVLLFYCFNSFIERCSNGKSANGTPDPCEALSLLNFVYI